MRFPFTSADLKSFLDDLPFILVQSSNPARPQATADEQRVRDFGRQLFEALFAGEVGRLYRTSHIVTETMGKGLRLKLRIRPPELDALPWEFLFDPQRDEYLCLSRYAPLVRYSGVEGPIRPLEVEWPLRVLGFAASPRRMFQIDIAEEKKRLTGALGGLIERNLVELTWWEGETWRDLQAAMRSGPWHIFHFVGHGTFPAGADEGEIILSDEAGLPHLLATSDFARLLVDHLSLRAVVLDLSEGARRNMLSVSRSTAAVLTRNGIPAVVAMQYPISEAVALYFARELYQALTGWLPIDAAVAEARKAVRIAGGNSLEWGNPTLYMNSPDGVLFVPASEVETIAPVRSLPLHNLPPRREFTGREAQKAQVHAALRSRTSLITIVGIGGIGKTALALEVVYECLNANTSKRTTGEPIAAFAGIVWVTAKDRDLTLNTMLGTIAYTLNRTSIALLPIEERLVAIRQLLQAQPILLVVDNFETTENEAVYDFLSKLPEPSKALIASRERKPPEARIILLPGLTESEAIELIRGEGRRLGLAQLESTDKGLLVELHRATGGSPLALKWAVGQIKQKGQALDVVLRQLDDTHGELYAAIFDRSWDQLSTNARGLLSIMPLFDASPSLEALEAVSDLHGAALTEALEKLISMSLLNVANEPGDEGIRYSVHPLTKAFAAAQLKEDSKRLLVAQTRLQQYLKAFGAREGSLSDQPDSTQIDLGLSDLCYLSLHCIDSVVEVGQPIRVILNLSLFSLGKGEIAITKPKRELSVHLSSDGLSLQSERIQTLVLPSFSVKDTQKQIECIALRPGRFQLAATIGTETATRHISTHITISVLSSELKEIPKLPSPLEPRIGRYPDLIVRVYAASLDEATRQHRFSYVAYSSLTRLRLPGVSIGTSWVPQTRLTLIRKQLADIMSSINSASPASTYARLSALGRALYWVFFPPEARKLYEEVRSANLLTWQTLCESEPWIPWELVKPFGSFGEDDFLAGRFAITRGIEGLGTPSQYEFPLGPVSLTLDDRLSQHHRPREWVDQFAGDSQSRVLPQLLGEFEGGYTLAIKYATPVWGLHFEGIPDSLARSAGMLTLADARHMFTQEAVQNATLDFWGKRPLVTFGMIRPDRQAALTEMERVWVPTFVKAGIGAFVGTYWAVDPRADRLFWSAFYQAIWERKPLGEAVLNARQFVRAALPDSMDWLAFFAVGDPMARGYVPKFSEGYAWLECLSHDLQQPLRVGESYDFYAGLTHTPPVAYHGRRHRTEPEAMRQPHLMIFAPEFDVEPDRQVALHHQGERFGQGFRIRPRTSGKRDVFVKFFDGDDLLQTLDFTVEVEGDRP